jgi:OOP family OmpA-OmpF porin
MSRRLNLNAHGLWIGLALLLTGAVQAQDMDVQVELLGPLSTQNSHKGDTVTARVLSPDSLKGDIAEGKVTEVKSGSKIHGTAVLNFTFETLQHGGQAIPISGQIKSITNSKGQADVDEEGRVIRKGGNVGKALIGTGVGGLLGGLAGGAKGAAIGAGVGAAASLVLIEVAAQGPSVRFDPGSRITLSCKSRNGPDLASLTRAAGAPAQPAAAPAPTAAAAPAEASAAPQAASTAPGSAAQPDLAAIKADFIPGEKTVFYDDFTDMAGDEPPPHWKIRGGTAELRVGAGVRQLTLRGRNVSLVPDLTGLPPNFTYETEVVYSNHGSTVDWGFFDKSGKEVMRFYTDRVYDNLGIEVKVGDETLISQQFKTDFSQPVKQNLWCQNGRLRLYLNGQRVMDVNQVKLPEMGTPKVQTSVVNDPDNKEYIAFRIARFAESTPDFSQTISSSGRYVTHGILFDTDSDRIKPESAAVIRSVARGLETNPNLKLKIEGHTDSTGNADHNLDLSKRRAEAVKAVLVSQFAVDAARLTTDGLGSSKPIDSNDTPQGRAQNRRVEFVKQ